VLVPHLGVHTGSWEARLLCQRLEEATQSHHPCRKRSLELNQSQPAWGKRGNGSASRLLRNVLLHGAPGFSGERWRRTRLGREFDELMDLRQYLDIIVQDMEDADPGVNGLRQHN
jgi:hypothetical protein